MPRQPLRLRHATKSTVRHMVRESAGHRNAVSQAINFLLRHISLGDMCKLLITLVTVKWTGKKMER